MFQPLGSSVCCQNLGYTVPVTETTWSALQIETKLAKGLSTASIAFLGRLRKFTEIERHLG